jgi:hypothetical protein
LDAGFSFMSQCRDAACHVAGVRKDSKNAHFIGTFHPSNQNGQNGQANGQAFLNTLSFFSISLQTKKQQNWHSAQER